MVISPLRLLPTTHRENRKSCNRGMDAAKRAKMAILVPVQEAVCHGAGLDSERRGHWKWFGSDC